MIVVVAVSAEPSNLATSVPSPIIDTFPAAAQPIPVSVSASKTNTGFTEEEVSLITLNEFNNPDWKPPLSIRI